MEKKKLKITIITNDSKSEYNTLGNYDKEKEILSYQEKLDLITNVLVKKKEKEIIRDNKDFNMKCYFDINKETTNTIYLKELDSTIDIKIKTVNYNYDNNKLEIEYILMDSKDKVYYKIEY